VIAKLVDLGVDIGTAHYKVAQFFDGGIVVEAWDKGSEILKRQSVHDVKIEPGRADT